MKTLRLLCLLLLPLSLAAQRAIDNATLGGTNTVKSGATLAIASGGTFTYTAGASVGGSASEFRTDIGLAIGTNVQAYDADLTTYAGITPGANVQTFLGAADYAAMRTQLGLTIGTNVQAFDADLTTYAGITPSANVQTLLGSADYAAFRASLGVGAGSLPGAPTTGDLAYYNGSAWVSLGIGTAGQVLKVNSGATAPTWVTPHNFYVAKAADQSISNTTVTAISFDTETWDTGSFYSSGTDVTITAATAGRWDLYAHVDYASNSTGLRQCYIKVNGATVQTSGQNAVNGDDSRVNIQVPVALVNGDVVTLHVWQNSGGSLNVKGKLWGIRRQE